MSRKSKTSNGVKGTNGFSYWDTTDKVTKEKIKHRWNPELKQLEIFSDKNKSWIKDSSMSKPKDKPVKGNLQYLFAYGSVNKPSVQMMLFNKIKEGTDDSLPGFRLMQFNPSGILCIEPDENENSAVDGIVYSIGPQELARLDMYEGPDYTRKDAVTSSGKKVVYYTVVEKL